MLKFTLLGAEWWGEWLRMMTNDSEFITDNQWITILAR